MASYLSSEEQDRILAIFGESELEEVFQRVVRFLNQHPLYLDIHDAATVEDHEGYLRAQKMFSMLLGAIANARPSVPVRLPNRVTSRLQKEIESFLRSCTWEDVYPLLLCFLKVVDQRFGLLILDEFYTERARIVETAIPVQHNRLFPKPWPAFNPEIPGEGAGGGSLEKSRRKINNQSRPPNVGVSEPLLQIERHLAWLAFPIYGECYPVPALHVNSDWGLVNKAEWKVATACVLAAESDVEWNVTDEHDQKRFWAVRLRAQREVRSRLLWVLSECATQEVDFLLLPELTVDPAAREEIDGFLDNLKRENKPCPVVIAGLLHEVEDAERGTHRNRPGLWSKSGALAWEYWKLSRSEERGMKEALGEHPPHVVAIDLPLGRLSIAICKDVLEAPFRNALEQLRTNVLVLLSMTGDEAVQQFRQHARQLASSSWMVTLYCNASIHYRDSAEPPVHQPKVSDVQQSTRRSPAVLSFVHPHTKIRLDEIPTQNLGNMSDEATLAIYTLRPEPDGLVVTRTDAVYPPTGREGKLQRSEG